MGVEREELRAPLTSGLHSVLRATRAPSGKWSLEVYLDLTVYLEDGRRVKLQRTVNLQATEQRGRKRRELAGVGKPDAR